MNYISEIDLENFDWICQNIIKSTNMQVKYSIIFLFRINLNFLQNNTRGFKKTLH